MEGGKQLLRKTSASMPENLFLPLSANCRVALLA
jgi:hypothetical protein